MDQPTLFARKQWLELQRKRLGMTQAQVAKKLGVMESEYVAYEEGRKEDHPDIELSELRYFFDHMVEHKMVGGDPRIKQDRCEK